MYRVLVFATFLSCACSFTVQEGEISADSYFSYQKDRTSGTSSRIIGGQVVEPHTYPFQAALLIYKGNGMYFCGGSLISSNLVLTAAHCVSMQPDYIVVGLGVHNLTNTPEAVSITTTDYVYHSGWNNATFINDVALVRLPENVTFNEYIQPVQLANGTDKYEGDRATLIGWGQTEYEELSMVLKSVNSTILSNTECVNQNIYYKEIIKSSHICTSGSGTVGVCSGDSGGPLIVNGIQVGITSFGTSNCSLGMPSGFTRVSEFHDWIARGSADSPHGLQFMLVVFIALCSAYIFN